MTIRTKSFAAFCAVLLAAPAAFADQPPADALPPGYVIHRLVSEGHDLRALEFDDGVYEAEVRTADGKRVELAVDPRSGAVLPNTRSDRKGRSMDPAAVSASEAIGLVAESGHYDVAELDYEHDAYEVKARDAQGRLARFKVDARTGKLSPRS